MATTTFTMNMSEESLAPAQAGGGGAVYRVLGLSIVSGPLGYLACRALSEGFAGGDQGLALAAFCAIGFEAVWLVYGLILLIVKGLTAAKSRG